MCRKYTSSTSKCHAQSSPFTVLTLPPHRRLPIVRPAPGQRTPPIKTQARGATILPNFVGLKFQVHNGKIYHDVTITEEMVGHKLGEFSPLVYVSRVSGKGGENFGRIVLTKGDMLGRGRILDIRRRRINEFWSGCFCLL